MKLRRCSLFSPLSKQITFRLLTISKINTPKLKTFDFIENCPDIAYSGAIYRLHININKASINVNDNIARNSNIQNFQLSILLWLSC